uniref:NADH-ubiquinone oxidoreductase chain 6 n=1 Tax=Anaspis sp. ANA02 TaxID=1205536 RepID=A0A0S2MR02_9CUCU|nr:NADH deshydrogenase subunit 6 [Anaspis sp. ANA02]
MILTLFLLNLSLSLIFLFLTHPLSMGLILLIQTMVISLITGNFCLNYWFSYILFLILVGSMLILFIYMTSIASNEKFYFNKNFIFLIFVPIFSFMFNKMTMNINTINTDMYMSIENTLLSMSMIKYLSFPSNLILMFLIIYLLLTLIVIVKITNFKNGPLRLKN